jgi:hypothetical protein
VVVGGVVMGTRDGLAGGKYGIGAKVFRAENAVDLL